jgi:protein subunit release factor A
MKNDNNQRACFSVTKKDLTVTLFSGTGAGGQHRNKHQNCIRIKHNDTGIIKTGQSSRSREANTKGAMEGLAADPRFKSFCEMKLREIEEGQTVEQVVDDMMRPENLKCEVKLDGRWVDCENSELK